MPTIQEQFHTIANCHNKITVAASCTKEFLKAQPLNTLSQKELKEKQEELVSVLEKIVKDTLAANQKISELRDFIYKKLAPKANF